MIYLASPYSHKDKVVVETRYYYTCDKCAEYIKKGILVYSPIVHNHVIALEHDIPGDFKFWKKFDEEMIRKSSEVHVLKLDGWELSKGVENEIKFAKSLNIPVKYINLVETL